MSVSPRRRKAAVLLMTLGENLAKAILRALPDIDVEHLTTEPADLRGITPEISLAVLEEFSDLLQTQSVPSRRTPTHGRTSTNSPLL